VWFLRSRGGKEPLLSARRLSFSFRGGGVMPPFGVGCLRSSSSSACGDRPSRLPLLGDGRGPCRGGEGVGVDANRMSWSCSTCTASAHPPWWGFEGEEHVLLLLPVGERRQAAALTAAAAVWLWVASATTRCHEALVRQWPRAWLRWVGRGRGREPKMSTMSGFFGEGTVSHHDRRTSRSTIRRFPISRGLRRR